jgi:hypothetical protein
MLATYCSLRDIQLELVPRLLATHRMGVTLRLIFMYSPRYRHSALLPLAIGLPRTSCAEAIPDILKTPIELKR